LKPEFIRPAVLAGKRKLHAVRQFGNSDRNAVPLCRKRQSAAGFGHVGKRDALDFRHAFLHRAAVGFIRFFTADRRYERKIGRMDKNLPIAERKDPAPGFNT
jgi:hypothetical protein